jgi:hypothetical protein
MALPPTLEELIAQQKREQEAAEAAALSAAPSQTDYGMAALNDTIANQTQSFLTGIEGASQYAFGDAKPNLSKNIALSRAGQESVQSQLSASEKAAAALKQRAAQIGTERGKNISKRDELMQQAKQKDLDRQNSRDIADGGTISITEGMPGDPTQVRPKILNRKKEVVFEGNPYKKDQGEATQNRFDERRQDAWIEKRKSQIDANEKTQQLSKGYTAVKEAKTLLDEIKSRVAAGEKVGSTGSMNVLITKFARSLQPGVLTNQDWQKSNAADSGYLQQVQKWIDEKAFNKVNEEQLQTLEMILNNVQRYNSGELRRLIDGFSKDVDVVNRERKWDIPKDLVIPGQLQLALEDIEGQSSPAQSKAPQGLSSLPKGQELRRDKASGKMVVWDTSTNPPTFVKYQD